MTDLIADLRQKLAPCVPPYWMRWSDNRRRWRVSDHDGWSLAECVRQEDAELIVAAVNALPGLLDELEAARQLIDFLDSPGPLSGWTLEATNEWHHRRRALAFDVSEARAANEGSPS